MCVHTCVYTFEFQNAYIFYIKKGKVKFTESILQKKMEMMNENGDEKG